MFFLYNSLAATSKQIDIFLPFLKPEILIALIQRQKDLDLMETEKAKFDGSVCHENDPAKWLDKNRRILEKYQSLVTSAITLDALLESEQSVNE